MKEAVYLLDADRCSAYVKNKLAGWGYFANKLAIDDLMADGRFYCIAPDNTGTDLLYAMDQGWVVYPHDPSNDVVVDGFRFSPNINFSKDVTLSAIKQHIAADNNFLLLEDYCASPNDPYVLDNDFEYCIAGEAMVYLLDKNSSDVAITKYINAASTGYITLLFVLRATGLIVKNNKEQLVEEVKNRIFNGISAFFLEIYDGESYLFWIKNSEEELLQAIQNKL